MITNNDEQLQIPSLDHLPTLNIESYKIEAGPPTVYYVPDFLTEGEEKDLLDAVNSVPKPRWTQLSNRRLQNWGGIPHPKGMIAEDLPGWLKVYTERLASLNIFDTKTPNHILVNEYIPGQGIMPHLDGPLFFPTIATINLSSHTFLNFYHPITEGVPGNSSTTDNGASSSQCNWNDRLAFSLLLQPRSLVILKDKVYDHYLHGIDEVSEDVVSQNIINLGKCSDIVLGQKLERSTRVSLTIRYVPKTTKPIIKLSRR